MPVAAARLKTRLAAWAVLSNPSLSCRTQDLRVWTDWVSVLSEALHSGPELEGDIKTIVPRAQALMPIEPDPKEEEG